MSRDVILRTALALSALCAGALVACGGGNDDTSPESLRQQMLPASELPGFKSERKFDFDNPIDFVHEALPLPEATPLSQAVDAFENAGFEAGVGERLVKGKPFEGPPARVNIAELGSDDDARDALEYVRKEALKQPFFAVCSVSASEFAVARIPGAKGAQLSPLRDPPPNAPPPFQAYSIAFTIGPRLYLVNADGVPGQVERNQVVSAAQALYERNAKSDAGS